MPATISRPAVVIPRSPSHRPTAPRSAPETLCAWHRRPKLLHSLIRRFRKSMRAADATSISAPTRPTLRSALESCVKLSMSSAATCIHAMRRDPRVLGPPHSAPRTLRPGLTSAVRPAGTSPSARHSRPSGSAGRRPAYDDVESVCLSSHGSWPAMPEATTPCTPS
jgi:hypothetical protein